MDGTYAVLENEDELPTVMVEEAELSPGVILGQLI